MVASTSSPAIKALEDEIAAVEKAQQPTRKKIADLEAELVEGEQIIARNRQALAILTGKTPVAVSARNPARSRSKAQLSADSEGREHRIIEVLGQNPDGMTGKALSETLGVAYQTAKKNLDVLVEAGTIKRTGEKRGTKYLPA